ncbi:hypothetical protein Fmac_008359 [Flemingia macrophylla]|uniref:Uncharacterized protein n=1 Tax=Flemingia macrophylla TaxID=520843 RepID=A0ABD1MX95_9FABA
MSILRLTLKTSIADHHNSRGQTLNREDGFQLPLEGKLDALGNLVTQLAMNQKYAFDARQSTTTVEARHLIEKMASNSQLFGVRNDVIVIRGVHDVATVTHTETRKLEGKLDALVNLVTHLAVNQKSISVARVLGIRSSNDPHTNVCPSLQQS